MYDRPSTMFARKKMPAMYAGRGRRVIGLTYHNGTTYVIPYIQRYEEGGGGCLEGHDIIHLSTSSLSLLLLPCVRRCKKMPTCTDKNAISTISMYKNSRRCTPIRCTGRSSVRLRHVIIGRLADWPCRHVDAIVLATGGALRCQHQARRRCRQQAQHHTLAGACPSLLRLQHIYIHITCTPASLHHHATCTIRHAYHGDEKKNSKRCCTYDYIEDTR